ncbi:major facilitator superfamily domain-containing protein [Trichoderma novae-zelandiae]
MAQVELEFPADAPLLADNERQPDHSHRRDDDDDAASPPALKAARWQVKSPKTAVNMIAFLEFMIVASGMLLMIPVFRLIEDTVCHVYYGDDSLDLIDEMKCKADEVQARMAYLLGWLGLFNSIMSLLTTFPYGMLADKIGRKPTVLLAYGGMALSPIFGPLMLGLGQHVLRRNPYLLMISSLFLLIGGGAPVVLAMLYAMAADVSSEKDKAASFLKLTFGATAGGLAGPLLTGFLMERFGPWVPIFVACSSFPLTMLLFCFIPETLRVDRRTKMGDNDVSIKALRQQLSNSLTDLREALGLLKNPSIPLVLLTFLFQSARFTAYTSTIIQYVSKHFGWRLAETSFLLAPFGLLNLTVLAVLPKISDMLMSRRFGYSSFGKDLFLTRYSTVLLLVGALIEGFSHNIALFVIGLFVETFGAAASPLARATVTHYVEPEFVSRLYALVSTSEIVGSFIGGPVLAWCFDVGLQKKGVWTGLPWFYIALLSTITWIGLLFVRPPPAKKDVADESGETEPMNPHDE